MSFGCYFPEQANAGLVDTAAAISGRGKLQQLQDRGRYVLASTAPQASIPDSSMRGQSNGMWRTSNDTFESSRRHSAPLMVPNESFELSRRHAVPQALLREDVCDNFYGTCWIPPSQPRSMECHSPTSFYSGHSLQKTAHTTHLLPSPMAGPPPPPSYAPLLAPRTMLERSDGPPPLPPRCWDAVAQIPSTPIVHPASSSRTSVAETKTDVERQADDTEEASDAKLSLPPGARLAEQLALSPGKVTIKNTFIDGGLDLKEFIRLGRQVHSCPGSRLASPRGHHGVSPRTSPKTSPRNSPTVVSSTASTVDTAEAMTDHESVASNVAVMRTIPSAAARHLRVQQAWIASRIRPPLATPQVLNLEEVLELTPPDIEKMTVASAESECQLGRFMTRPALGSQELPSLGSIGHHARRCKPCAFATRFACANGTQCHFCHLCGHGEKKRRRKEKRILLASSPKVLLARKASAPEALMLS